VGTLTLRVSVELNGVLVPVVLGELEFTTLVDAVTCVSAAVSSRLMVTASQYRGLSEHAVCKLMNRARSSRCLAQPEQPHERPRAISVDWRGA
jgi:hypothetical protein